MAYRSQAPRPISLADFCAAIRDLHKETGGTAASLNAEAVTRAYTHMAGQVNCGYTLDEVLRHFDLQPRRAKDG